MKNLSLSRSALTVCVAAILFVGCGGSQFQPRALQSQDVSHSVTRPVSVKPLMLSGERYSGKQQVHGSHYMEVEPPSYPDCVRIAPLACRPGVPLPTLRFLAGPAQLPAGHTRDAVAGKCPGKQLGAVCGTVAVPLDRKHPQRATIRIFYELFVHGAGGPARSAILVNYGGPGGGTTDPFDTYVTLYFFAPSLLHDDLLLIDDRGRGFSDTIDCAPLQNGKPPFPDAEADCAAQLGQAASFFGTGDIAKDTDAVRAALGYNKVDYYGASYGGEDISAYATRFGSHLRAIVLDAPEGTPGLDPLTFAHYSVGATPRMVRLVCTYSPTCRPDHPDAVADLDWLIGYIQGHTIEGDAYNAGGTLMHVQIDEQRLLDNVVFQPTGAYVSTGEILAASQSLRHGDRAPLLRLGAEGFFTLSSFASSSDVNAMSMGSLFATLCVDEKQPWNWSDPVPERIADYVHAVGAVPPGYFSPFSKAAVITPLSAYVTGWGPCLWWQKPTSSSPVTPPNPVYPKVPTLVLDGNIDDIVPLEEVKKVAALFPGSKFFTVAESGHFPGIYSQCARNAISKFMETLHPGDTGCLAVPEEVFPAVGRFPLLAKDAAPAAVDPHGHNEIGLAQRKAVTVAVAAAIDALKRTTIAGANHDHCLRIGTFSATYTQEQTRITFAKCSFTEDVSVDGTATWGASSAFSADLVLRGPGTPGGTIHVAGKWRAVGPVHNFEVSGKIGGLNVAVLIPEA